MISQEMLLEKWNRNEKIVTQRKDFKRIEGLLAK
jgi:hypothetical protein